MVGLDGRAAAQLVQQMAGAVVIWPLCCSTLRAVCWMQAVLQPQAASRQPFVTAELLREAEQIVR